MTTPLMPDTSEPDLQSTPLPERPPETVSQVDALAPAQGDGCCSGGACCG